MFSEPTIYFYVVLGIIISIVLPILRNLLPSPELKSLQTEKNWLWKLVKPYLIIGLFSCLAAIVILASLPKDIEPEFALLAGYAWDSTLQKLSNK